MEVDALRHHSDDSQTDQQQKHILGFAPHRTPPRTTNPTTEPTTVATTNVAGAKRIANRRPNIPACIANSLTSTAGPTTRNTNRGNNGSVVRLAATNASASEHRARTTASNAIITTAKTTCPVRPSKTHGGNNTRNAAAAAVPTT